MTAKTNDNLYLAAGGVALLGSFVWAFLQQSNIDSLRESVSPPMSGRSYESAPLALTSPASQQWASPKPQSAGDKWLFDVFTPPVIYYNTDTKTFTVTQPVLRRVDDPVVVVKDPTVPAPFGLELVNVEQGLFRLQLIGNVGEGPNARGNFLNVSTGELLFATKGKKIPSLNLEIISFSAERVKTKIEGGTELIETIIKAVVRDTVTGEEIPLDAKARRPEGPLVGTFKKSDGTIVTGKSGEILTVDGHAFLIGALQQIPPSAAVTKSGGDLAAPEARTLVIPPPPKPVVEGTTNVDGNPVPPPAGNVPF